MSRGIGRTQRAVLETAYVAGLGMYQRRQWVSVPEVAETLGQGSRPTHSQREAICRAMRALEQRGSVDRERTDEGVIVRISVALAKEIGDNEMALEFFEEDSIR